jgi:lipopolysaccharide exporter
LIAQPVATFFGDSRLCFVMLALSAGTLISGLENIGTIDFRRDLAFRKEFDMQLLSRVIGATTTIFVAGIWRTYWALVAGILLSRLARLAQSYLMSSYRPGLTLRAWRQIIGFSLWTWAQTIVYQAKERSDSIVIVRVLGASQVGVFSIGLELGSLPTTELVEPLGRALFSGFASLHNASEGLRSMFLGAIGLGLMLILPAGIGISMVADPMIRLSLGVVWVAAVPVVQIVAIGGTTAIFSYACGNLLNAVGRPHVAFYIAAVSAVVKLVGLLFLVPRFGLIGATVAILMASAVELLLLLAVTLPRIGVSLRSLAGCAIRPFVATVAMGVVLWQCGMAWTPSEGNDFADFAQDAGTRCALGAACYITILVGTWMVAGRPDGAERQAVRVAGQLWNRVRRTTP